ncbi:MAG TPA: hypothetical protein VGD81_05990 [Opitutaceae bacterium]
MATTRQKVERALYGPSISEVTLGAVLSVALGVIVAAVYLVAKPVEKVRELPKEPASDVVYYLEGSRDSTKGKQWMRKRQMLVEGQSAEIALTEDELNAWAGAGAKPATDTTSAASGIIRAESVNFRVRDGWLQIGVPSTFDVFGFVVPVVLQARGDFEKQGDQFVFVPREFMIGSLPAHRLPGLEGLLGNKLLASQNLPEDIATAWKKLADARVDGNTLRLTLP